VLYVGKAKSLRSRLASYFAAPGTLPAKTVQLLAAADRVEWVQTGSEAEALMLEYALIKAHRPRFNVRLVDDKSYPWLAVTLSDEWPRAAVVRGKRRDGTRYFGPYAHVGAIRETLDLLLRSLPVRTCSEGKFARHRKIGKPCLLYHIERCSGPCVGAVDRGTYDGYVSRLMAFLDGDTEPIVRSLQKEMQRASDSLDFERAARLRDALEAVNRASQRQQVVLDRPEDIDVIGIDEDPLEAAVCVLHVRRGRVVGRRALLVDKVEELSRETLISRVLEQLYAGAVPTDRAGRSTPKGWTEDSWTSGSGDPSRYGLDGTEPEGVPRRVLVPSLPEDPDVLRQFLTDRRGGPVDLLAPRRGARRSLVETAQRNASEELARNRLRRAADHAARARALEALQQHLGLPQAPLRIECYDTSHLAGTSYVASMVVLEDGLPRRSEYRRFALRGVPGNDDYAAMEEVLTRRLTSLVEARRSRTGQAAESDEPRSGRKAFAYPPQLLLLDGGRGQLGVGVSVLERSGLSGEIPVASLAKRFEEVYVPNRPEPVEIPRDSPALYLLQQIRDEAHRFAISYHRSLRSKRMTRSALDGVPGLGPARRARLLRELGSLAKVRKATLEELLSIGWLPDAVGRSVHERLHRV
jgi:excinuclease ABC subunit C